MLNVRYISSSESDAACWMMPKTAGTFHAPRTTRASHVLGSARLRFSVIPPPVMCAMPFTFTPERRSASTERT